MGSPASATCGSWPTRRSPFRRARSCGATIPDGTLRWPLELRGRTPGGEDLLLRPLARRDRIEFARLRARNLAWLQEWEATSPVEGASTVTFNDYVRNQHAEAREGRLLPLVITTAEDGAIVGQLNTSNIVLGAARTCTMGYWVSRSVAGRGIMPTAVAIVADHLMRAEGLHRVEINIRPENAASLAVVRKLGFRDEGLRPHFLHIDGAWRDHRSFAVTTEDLAGRSLMQRLNQQSQQSLQRHTEERPL
ncbi:GNAT family N-acetyltransferase [Janibacter sp. G1551]|uniref:GNAT family N-acetyltransferase n=1 Tax=Janibacter sp. G1551 TaxID=3420440 RepID=UPI003D0370E1